MRFAQMVVGADIDRDIKGNAVKGRINEGLISALLELEEPTENYDTLRNRLINDLNLYRESEDAQELMWKKDIVSLPDGLDQLAELLMKPLDTPKLTDREHRLLALLAQHPQHSTEETRQMLAENWAFCPMCLREITEHDKTTIVQTLTHILNEEAKQYELLLSAELNKFAMIETSLPVFKGSLNEQELKRAQAALTNLNHILYSVRQKINQRKG